MSASSYSWIISQIVFGLIHCIAMAFVVTAVFKGRDPGKSFDDSDSAVDGLPKNDPNPYASPSA